MSSLHVCPRAHVKCVHHVCMPKGPFIKKNIFKWPIDVPENGVGVYKGVTQEVKCAILSKCVLYQAACLEMFVEFPLGMKLYCS